jgi:hypothetical protein
VSCILSNCSASFENKVHDAVETTTLFILIRKAYLILPSLFLNSEELKDGQKSAPLASSYFGFSCASSDEKYFIMYSIFNYKNDQYKPQVE